MELNDLNLNKPKKTRQWNVETAECAGTGQTLECNLFATHKGEAELDVISKTLSCGCVLFPQDEVEEPEPDEGWVFKP